MKDNDTLHTEKPVATNPKQKTDATSSPSQPARARSSGRGLYITAIVLGIIIVVLLALYIFLSLTVKRPSHGVAIPVNMAVNQINSLKMLDF